MANYRESLLHVEALIIILVRANGMDVELSRVRKFEGNVEIMRPVVH